MFTFLKELIAAEYLGLIIRVGIMAIVGFPLIWFAARMVRKVLAKKTSTHIGVLVGNITFYSGLVILSISILNELGFQLSALLGAAGIIGIAVGFAAQTSVSNIISGIFLLLERSFTIGDTIKHDGIVGVVESIDLLSVKLRTFDNQLVRIPNENIIKSATINRTFYPIRRFELKVRAPYDQEIEPVIQLLDEIIRQDEQILKDPKALVAIAQVSPWAIEFVVRAWTSTDKVFSAPREMIAEIKRRGNEQGMKISAHPE